MAVQGAPGGVVVNATLSLPARLPSARLLVARLKVAPALGDCQRLAGDGEGVGARRPEVGVKREHHGGATRAALIGRAQMQPGGIRRGCPRRAWRRGGQRHTVAAAQIAFREVVGGQTEGGSRLGDCQRLAGDGEGVGARRPEVGVKREHHGGATRAALIGRAQMQPGGIRRGCPRRAWRRGGQRHTVAAAQIAFREVVGGQTEGGPRLGDRQRLAGDGEGVGARRPEVGVKREHHGCAARAALIGWAQMQPGGIGRRRPQSTRRGGGQRHAVAAAQIAFCEVVGAQRIDGPRFGRRQWSAPAGRCAPCD